MNRTTAGLFAAAAVFSPYCGAENGVNANRILLGQAAVLSGPAAQLGIQMNKGARIYFDSLNAAGGIHGTQIELRTLDDGYEPDRAVQNSKRFIEQDKVFALFGYVGTPTSYAVVALVTEAKIPFFGPFLLRYTYDFQHDATALIVRAVADTSAPDSTEPPSRAPREIICGLAGRSGMVRLEARILPAVFTVNSFTDGVDAHPGDGVAQTSDGRTTLRAAIMEANALGGVSTVVLPAGSYTLSLPGPNEDAADSLGEGPEFHDVPILLKCGMSWLSIKRLRRGANAMVSRPCLR